MDDGSGCHEQVYDTVLQFLEEFFHIFLLSLFGIVFFVFLQRRTFQYAGGVVRTAGYWEVLAYKGSSLVAA